MSIDQNLLQILVCPENLLPVKLADNLLLARLNADIAQGIVSNRAGNVVTRRIEAALIREDGKVLYPIVENIPLMLPAESIEL